MNRLDTCCEVQVLKQIPSTEPRQEVLESVFLGRNPERADPPTPTFWYAKTLKVSSALQSVFLDAKYGKPKP